LPVFGIGNGKPACAPSIERPSFSVLALDRRLGRVVDDELRERDRAMRRIDVDAEARVLLHQRLGAFGQLRRMRRHVLGVDLQARLLRGERIRAARRRPP
jgi:hypothetical protein